MAAKKKTAKKAAAAPAEMGADLRAKQARTDCNEDGVFPDAANNHPPGVHTVIVNK